MCVLITITGVLSGGLHVIKHRCAFFNHLSRQCLYHSPCTGLHCLHRQWYWRLNQGCRSMCTDCLTSQREFVTQTVSFEPMNLGSESRMRGRLPNHQITGIVVTAHSVRETYRSTHCCRSSTAVTSESALRMLELSLTPWGIATTVLCAAVSTRFKDKRAQASSGRLAQPATL